MELPEKILIVGLGKTGIATARFLRGKGIAVGLADEKPRGELTEALGGLKDIPYEGYFGPHRKEDFLAYPLIVLSPGVDGELPFFKELRQEGVKIVGEIELASRFIASPIIAITGTNGKTTTTTLMGEVFKAAFGDVFVGGNIGNPLINYAGSTSRTTFIILEVSSFQLETIENFRPHTAILLNITEDHLDRYRSYDEYVAAKYRIFENQRPNNCALLGDNVPSPKKGTPKVVSFSTSRELPEGAFARRDDLVVRLGGKEWIYKRSMSPLVGVHNTENILAVLLTAHIYGVDPAIIEGVLRNFKGLPHRVEFVRNIDGVHFYNDSKATNVDAAKRALESMPGNVILIAGGKDKGGSYEAIRQVARKVTAMIVIGEAKERIARELGDVIRTYRETDMESAVRKAKELCQPGDIVLLSPMCSSFDMFASYKDRGDTFRRLVESL